MPESRAFVAAPHFWQDMTASAVPILFERVCSKCLFADTGKEGLFKFAVVAKSRAKEVKGETEACCHWF